MRDAFAFCSLDLSRRSAQASPGGIRAKGCRALCALLEFSQPRLSQPCASVSSSFPSRLSRADTSPLRSCSRKAKASTFGERNKRAWKDPLCTHLETISLQHYLNLLLRSCSRKAKASTFGERIERALKGALPRARWGPYQATPWGEKRPEFGRTIIRRFEAMRRSAGKCESADP